MADVIQTDPIVHSISHRSVKQLSLWEYCGYFYFSEHVASRLLFTGISFPMFRTRRDSLDSYECTYIH